jgi:hypothetical protein
MWRYFDLCGGFLSKEPVWAIILKCDYNARHAIQDPASEEFHSSLCFMAWPRCGICVAACRSDADRGEMD